MPTKSQPEEKRIYTILAETVDVCKSTRRNSPSYRRVRMPIGRMAAQHGHVVSRMRMGEIEKLGNEAITTIALSVRNSRELTLIHNELVRHFGSLYAFFDEGPDFYGSKLRVKTALCTPRPAPHSEIDRLIGHLPLFAEGL